MLQFRPLMHFLSQGFVLSPRYRRVVASGALAVAALALVPGCGNAIYAVQVSSASSRLEEARELRAEELAPYEYTMAVEHLKQARTEAAEADYGDAITFAETCEEYSEKAIRISQEAHRSAGR
jgi:hypothetical protein